MPVDATPTPQAVLIVGASRGLGLGLAREWLRRGWNVVGTVRGDTRTALHDAADASAGHLVVEHLEITDPAAIAALHTRLQGRSFDVLFVNAGIANGPQDRVDLVSAAEFTRVMLTNALGPMQAIEALGPLVPPGGTLAAMSSSLGSVSLNDRGGWETYRASKAALNTLMRSHAARHTGDGRSLALVDPGWVRTDMGGPDAGLSVEDSVPGIVDALLARMGQPGLQYFNHQGRTVPW